MLQTFMRTIIMYSVVMISMRLMGKRQVGQLEPNELAIMILISELAAIPMQDNEMRLFQGILPIATLVTLEILTSVAALKNIRLRGVISGRPNILIENGKLQRKEIKKSRMTLGEVMEELRIKGVTDLSMIQYAIMETNGQISVILYPEHQPATAGQIGVREESKGMPVIVLNDGRWIDKNLQKRGITREYVQKELARRGTTDLEQLYAVIVDELNHVYAAGK
jgi:uncharacterized membrane protein YcaP (DUF421 family)